MTHQAKALLRRSLAEYNTAQEPQKQQMVATVKRYMKSHENSLKTIGFGYADHFVEAGKVFLRIARK